MRFPLVALSVFLGLCAASARSAEAGLPDGMTLPAGMSLEQAKAGAKAQGITTREQAEAAAREQGVTLPTGARSAGAKATLPAKVDSLLDSEEGGVTLDTLDSLGRPESRRRKRGAEDLARLRYAQRIFRSANPSLFASHVGAVGSNYQLGPGDQVVLTLWGQKEARYELVLDRSGQISVEGMGLVSLNGLSLREAQALLKNRLTRLYSGMSSGQTSMDLTLGKLRQIRVFVNGDVTAPGSYLLSGNTNVFNALYQAKGPTDLGSERKIEIVRGSSRFEVDLYAYLFKGVRKNRDMLQDGDIVRVPVRGPVVSIQGEVGRPGRYELLPSETAKELLVYCGGLTVNTASQNAMVTRIFQDGRREAVTLPPPAELASGKASAKLNDGDSLFLFKGSDPSRLTVKVGGEVRFPGAYPLRDGMKAQDLVALAGGYTHRVYQGNALLVRTMPDSSRASRSIAVEPASNEVLQPGDSLHFFNRFEFVTPHQVTVSGAVAHPGTFPLDSGMTTRDLILLAGGFVKEADPVNARLEIPKDSAQGAEVRRLVLGLQLDGPDARLELRDGMHIAVSRKVYGGSLDLVVVKGMATYPGSYSLQNSAERISSVLARAGGVRPEGYASGTWLVRPLIGRIAINVARALSNPGGNDDLVLRGGDTLLVPSRPATVTVSGRVNDPSNIPWREGKSWKWYVSMAGGMTDSADGERVYLRLADGSVQTRDYGIDSLPNPGSEIVVPFRRPPEPIKYTDIIGALGATASLILSAVTIFLLVNKS